MSAANLSELDNLVSATNSLAQALNSQMPGSAYDLYPIAISVQWFDLDGLFGINLVDKYIDLYDFAELINANF